MNGNFKISSIQIKQFYTGELSNDCENVRHEKICNSLSVVQSVVGSYDISIGSSKTFSTGEMGVFVAPSNELQTIVHHNGAEGKMHAHWVFIDAIVNDTFRLDEVISFPIILNKRYDGEVYALIQTLKTSENYFERIRAVYRILEILVSEGEEKQDRDVLKMRIEEYVCANYFKDVSANDIARYINYSPAQVYKLVKKYFSLSVANYINSVRLQKAEQMLLSSDYNITEVALAVGFEDCAYFSRLFKKSYGQSPKNYRINRQDNYRFCR
ncbi:MAG: helix-turn-helix transcriptional regulator [Clostridia bacterium]|nr:helix-turn-helix transcriptional regulator [Clostridia bacterium]